MKTKLEANAFSSLFLTFHQMPLQPWGEETEDGAIYSITLERVKAEPAASGASSLVGSVIIQRRTRPSPLLSQGKEIGAGQEEKVVH